ncbi:hypothetical protein C0J52_21168 [Blattella germanica]|nr:hypothetical protein C0J52_21168 [Blattella germanica]
MTKIVHLEEAYTTLKPACNRILKEPSRSHILELRCLLENASPVAVQKIKDVILFPLEIHLQNENLGSEIKGSLVDCMKVLFDNTWISNINRLFELYSLLFFQIYDKQKVNLVGDISEEFKLSVIEAVTTAIECVKTLTYVHNDAILDDDLRHQVGDVIMFFLPGIVSTLQRLATEDENQGHQVIQAAVEAWGQIITIVMEDVNKTFEPEDFISTFNKNEAAKETNEDPLRSSWHNSSKDSMLKSLQEKLRTPEWYQAAAEKLAYSVKTIAKVQMNSHWKVRLKLSMVCKNLVTRCYRNLKPCVVVLLEILIALAEDENKNVSEESKNGLTLFSEICGMQEGKTCFELLKDSFHELVTKLSRIIHGTDEVQQLAALRLLAGYIKLMERKLPELIKSTAHLNRLLFTLIHAIELEVSVSVLEDFSYRDLEENFMYGNSVPWKQFKYFVDNDILKKLVYICSIFGQYADLPILIHHLLDMFYNNSEHRKEIIILLNEILIGGAGRSDINLEAVVETVLEAYVEPSIWYLNVSVDTNKHNETTLKEVHNNVVQVCLLVEGIGKISKVLGSGFNCFLLKTLYLVLERVGSANGLIATAGIIAAQNIAFACGNGHSVSNLIEANADYLSFHVSRRLSRIEENQSVLDVLQVMMKFCNLDMLPVLEDIIQDVLYQRHMLQHENSISFMRVFYTFISSVHHRIIKKGTEIYTHDEMKTQYLLPENLKHNEIVNDLVMYHNCKGYSEDFSDYENVKETCNENTEIPSNTINSNVDASVHVNITVSILKECVNFIPTKKKELKLLVLSVLREGLLVLEENENQLLPVVHAMWSPFVDRFNEIQDPLIINQSFDLLCVLSKVSKDFIKARTVKQVLPALYQFLIKTAPESKKKDNYSSYRFTQTFKLQMKLLRNLDIVVCHLNMQERQITELLNAVSPYLSRFQPLPLQLTCVELFMKLLSVNQSAVWLKLNNMWSHSTLLKTPFTEMKTIKLSEKSDNQEEFKTNIEKILSFLSMNTNCEHMDFFILLSLRKLKSKLKFIGIAFCIIND